MRKGSSATSEAWDSFPHDHARSRAYRLLLGRLRVECPTGSARHLSLAEIADELSARLAQIFLMNGDGRRAVNGDSALFQDDPHFRDLVPFYEYFDGDTGGGVGASPPGRLDRARHETAPAAAAALARRALDLAHRRPGAVTLGPSRRPGSSVHSPDAETRGCLAHSPTFDSILSN